MIELLLLCRLDSLDDVDSPPDEPAPSSSSSSASLLLLLLQSLLLQLLVLLVPLRVFSHPCFFILIFRLLSASFLEAAVAAAAAALVVEDDDVLRLVDEAVSVSDVDLVVADIVDVAIDVVVLTKAGSNVNMTGEVVCVCDSFLSTMSLSFSPLVKQSATVNESSMPPPAAAAATLTPIGPLILRTRI